LRRPPLAAAGHPRGARLALDLNEYAKLLGDRYKAQFSGRMRLVVIETEDCVNPKLQKFTDDSMLSTLVASPLCTRYLSDPLGVFGPAITMPTTAEDATLSVSSLKLPLDVYGSSSRVWNLVGELAADRKIVN